MKTLNETVKSQLGELAFSLCEAEAVLSQREGRILELEAELETYKSSGKNDKPAGREKP